MNIFQNSKYILTTNKLSEMPQDDIPEIVIVGKSNVGKSTLINVLLLRKQIAKTSSKPGKTKAISFFSLDEKIRLVDIPGYGYANVSKSQYAEFGRMVDDFFTNRQNIVKAILLLDIRRGITEHDEIMINYFVELGIPFVIIGTKKDKANQSERAKFNEEINEKLQINIINYSSVTKAGIEEIKDIFLDY